VRFVTERQPSRFASQVRALHALSAVVDPPRPRPGRLVPAAPERHLRAGARSCMLFTDLANPTSNRIYADVGYRRFAEWEEHELEPAGR
jgi:hypothetical protein